MRAGKEKALELAGERSRAFGFQLAEGTDVDTNSKAAKNQQAVAPIGRRGFLRRAGATAVAAAVVVAVPAQAADPSELVRDANGFVIPAPIDSLGMAREYNNSVLAHLCLVSALMCKWYMAHEDIIKQKVPEFDSDLFDLMYEGSASADVIAKAAGVRPDPVYVAKCAAKYRDRAKASAENMGGELGRLSARQRTLLKYYDQLSDTTQLTIIDMAEEYTCENSLRRHSTMEIVGGAA